MKYLVGFFCLTLFFSCGGDQLEPSSLSDSYVVWEGPLLSFSKADGTDPEVESNQDRINDEVWITRGSSGGQIYNIVEENVSSKDISPLGTLWAIGELSELENLNFASFRSAVGVPREVVGKKLVMHLVEADVYLSVEFTSWSSGQSGGFAYNRSTP